MRGIIKVASLVAGLALGAFGMTANAASLTTSTATVTSGDVGYSFAVDFICSAALPCVGGNPGTTLAGQAVFKLTSVTNVSGAVKWGIKLVLSNTGMAGALTAMGFATNPNATLGSVTDSSWDGVVFGGGAGQIPGFSGTELCVFDGYGCSSTYQQELTKGKSNTMNFVLTTASGVSALTFSDFAAQIAGVGIYCRTYDMAGRLQVAAVPLPAGGGLLLAGLGGLALVRRKRKAA
jgi:hypothetical protein